MQNLSQQTVTEQALGRLEGCGEPRLRQVMTSLVRHLHGFVQEVELTEAEWFEAIRFLTATGQMCDDKRQEFILLSDVLGVSMLVDAISHRSAEGATDSTVLGPFYRPNSALRQTGDNIAEGETGEPCFVSGRVTSAGGAPLAGASLDVWQTDGAGLYDVQRGDGLDYRMRGRFLTEADGIYAFRTVKPVSYPIPTDGPVGRLLAALGRHAFRPAHIHFRVTAPGHAPLTTHIFVQDDPYLDSDAVFGVKRSLVADFTRHDEPGEAAKLGVSVPFYRVRYDFALQALG